MDADYQRRRRFGAWVTGLLLVGMAAVMIVVLRAQATAEPVVIERGAAMLVPPAHMATLIIGTSIVGLLVLVPIGVAARIDHRRDHESDHGRYRT